MLNIKFVSFFPTIVGETFLAPSYIPGVHNIHVHPTLRACQCCHILLYQSHPVVSIQLVYILTSYTTINIKIHTIKCYKFNGYMFRSPLQPSSGQLLQIVHLQCAYNIGSHNVYIIFCIWTKITVKSLHC